MRAARQIRRHTLRQRPAGCADGRAHGAPRPLDHALGPGEADFALLRRAEPALSDGVYISGAVGQGQLAVRGGFCQIQRQIWQFRRQALSQQLVLAHREAVTVRQFLDVGGGVVDVHPQIVGLGLVAPLIGVRFQFLN